MYQVDEKWKMNAGDAGALAGGIVYAVSAFFYLARRAFDLDLPFFLVLMVGTGFSFAIGIISGRILGNFFASFNLRRFRFHLITVIFCTVVFAALMLPSFIASEGETTTYGQSYFYGWPLPALGFNYVEVITREVTTDRTYYAWGVWTPGLLLDATLLSIVLGATAVSVEWMIERKRAND